MHKQQVRKRARQEDEKEERRLAIMATAWHLFATMPYEAVTIAGVAQEAGLAKGTVFLYFKTKEALFLALLEQQLLSWFADVDADLSEAEDGDGIARVVALLCAEIERRPGLARLIAILHTLLERNITLEEALRFKYLLKEHFEKTGALLEQRLPFLRPGQGAHVLLQCDALIIGFWHLADPAPVVRQALQQPDLRLFEVHFLSELSTAMQALLIGLAQAAQELNLDH